MSMEDDTAHDRARDAERMARNHRKATARKAARDLLAKHFAADNIQIDYDAKVYLPNAGEPGAWVDVRIWVPK